MCTSGVTPRGGLSVFIRVHLWLQFRPVTQTAPTESRLKQLLPVLALAAYLACSWTWCIGMYLPVLLVRDYGGWAWVAFALPNVVGAAAMGWVLRRPGASEAVAAGHAAAGAAFSVVTILFHVLFVWWVVWRLAGELGVALAVGSAAVFWLVGRRRGSRMLWLGCGVLVVSLAAFAVAVTRGELLPNQPPRWPEINVLWLVPVMLFGFALNPYLDLTFHRARQAATTPYVGMAAFTLGFGLLFLLMIVFTLWYAPFMTPAQLDPWAPRRVAVPVAVLWAVAVHMSVQTGFTVAVHAAELQRRWRLDRDAARRGTILGLVGGALPLAVAGVLLRFGGYRTIFHAQHIEAREVGYALFMAFYGLVFPAYVWICMIPSPDGRAGITRRKLWILAGAVALAAPTFWLGFVERDVEWLAPGLILVLLARLLLPRRAPDAPAENVPPETWRRARQRVFGRRAG